MEAASTAPTDGAQAIFVQQLAIDHRVVRADYVSHRALFEILRDLLQSRREPAPLARGRRTPGVRALVGGRLVVAGKACLATRAISLLLVVVGWVSNGHAGWKRYSNLIVADHHRSAVPPRQGVRVTYLGTNGYLLESREATLLIDPYFLRTGLGRVALNLPMVSDTDLIRRYLPSREIDAVLVTHGHFDHLLDATEVVRLTEAKLIASATSVRLATSTGVPGEKCVSGDRGKHRAASRGHRAGSRSQARPPPGLCPF